MQSRCKAKDVPVGRLAHACADGAACPARDAPAGPLHAQLSSRGAEDGPAGGAEGVGLGHGVGVGAGRAGAAGAGTGRAAGGGVVGREGVGDGVGDREAGDGAGVGRDGAGAVAARGAAGTAFLGATFLGATFRAAALARPATFLPAFLAFLAVAFTLLLTLAILPFARGRAFRPAFDFVRPLVPRRAVFFFAGFREAFFLAAALAMHHLHGVKVPRAINHAGLSDARSIHARDRRLARQNATLECRRTAPHLRTTPPSYRIFCRPS